MKVVSTKLSKEEHNAMLEMANLLGMNTAEYVRVCIMTELCGSQHYDIPGERKEQLKQMELANEMRFNGTSLTKKAKEAKFSSDYIIVHG